MDLQTLSKLLKDLITVHDRVSLPGLGGFVTELAPSVFSDKAMVIHPPFRRVLFKPTETWNDELLENLYADQADITVEDAKRELSSFLKEFKTDLNKQKSVILPEFGTMRSTEQHDYFFVADKDLFIYPGAYGLEPINIKILPKRGVVEVLTGKKSSIPAPPARRAYEQATPVTNQKQKVKNKKKKSNWGTVILTFLLLAVIILALMVIFKDQARPVWEWLLYSQEERELVRQLRP